MIAHHRPFLQCPWPTLLTSSLKSLKKLRIPFGSLALAILIWHLPSPVTARPAEGTQIMIAGPSPLSIEAGRRVARLGGNVVDVAVAVELVMAVTTPYYAGLGGGGFALIKFNNQVQALDFRETAPLATSPEFFTSRPPKAAEDGGAAVGVPGVPAGLWAMHKKYGKLHWSQLFDDAIALAQSGFEVSGEWAEKAKVTADRFNVHGRSIFLKKDGSFYRPGEKLIQRKLAALLKEMRNRGTAPFYQGMAARDMVKTVVETGGVLTLKDLESYSVRWLEPMTTSFESHKIYLMPPPSSSGLVITTALKLIDKLKVKEKPTLSIDELHMLGEILKFSFRGRSLLGDPDFHKNPMSNLLSDSYLDSLAQKISEKKASTIEALPDAWASSEKPETTHFSVMDGSGNVVAFTVTLNGLYGSAVVTEQFGIALNNEMDDFTTRPGTPNQFGLIQGAGNQIQPKKRPLSSMSPLIAEKDGKTVLAIGSPGGPRIISAVFQVLYRSLVSGLDMDEAIQFPRVHHQFLPNTLMVDPRKLPPETTAGLEKRGHKIEYGPVAKVYGVRINANGFLEGAFDLRGEGAAGGY